VFVRQPTDNLFPRIKEPKEYLNVHPTEILDIVKAGKKTLLYEIVEEIEPHDK